MELEKQNEFNGWAKVEINGHNTHIGMVTTQVFGTAVLFRIDQPEIPADERPSDRDGYLNGRSIPKGTIIKRGAIAAASVLVGAGSIYRITPCTEAAALKAIEQSVCRPLIPVGLPDLPALAEPEEDDEDIEVDEDSYMRQ
jgi:hypothetical protein